MSGLSNIPTVFIGSVDDGKNHKQLRQITREKTAISQILSPEHSESLFHVLEEDHPGGRELMQKLPFRNRINVLHLAGSAESVWEDHPRSLQLDDIWEGWAEIIGFIPNLDAVYLSGCATPQRIRTLIKRDLPAVLVTEAKTKDPRISDIAAYFYRQLATGKSIWSSFEAVHAKYPSFEAHKLTYHIENDWIEGYEDLLTGDIPWGLYYLDDHEWRLKKPYTGRKIIPIIPKKGSTPLRQKLEQSLTWLKYSAIVAFMALVASGLAFYLSRFFLG